VTYVWLLQSLQQTSAKTVKFVKTLFRNFDENGLNSMQISPQYSKVPILSGLLTELDNVVTLCYATLLHHRWEWSFCSTRGAACVTKRDLSPAANRAWQRARLVTVKDSIVHDRLQASSAPAAAAGMRMERVSWTVDANQQTDSPLTGASVAQHVVASVHCRPVHLAGRRIYSSEMLQ